MFQRFYGNEKALQTLAFFKESGRFCHAYLITGEEGLGKRTFARLLAAMVLCKDRGHAPCGECESCRKILAACHPDVIFEDGAGAKNSLHIDRVRTIRSDAYIRPNESEYKIYGLFDCDNMTLGAANALLKILEEPPRHALFLLTCKNPGALPETILSRCVQIPLSPVSEEECREALSKLAPQADPQALAQAVSAAGGNIGLGLRLLSSGDAAQVLSIASGCLDAIAVPGEYGLLKELAQCGSDRLKISEVLEQLTRLLRSAMLEKASGRSGKTPGEQALCARFSLEDFLAMLDVLREARDGIDKNVNPALLLTWISSNLKQRD